MYGLGAGMVIGMDVWVGCRDECMGWLLGWVYGLGVGMGVWSVCKDGCTYGCIEHKPNDKFIEHWCAKFRKTSKLNYISLSKCIIH